MPLAPLCVQPLAAGWLAMLCGTTACAARMAYLTILSIAQSVQGHCSNSFFMSSRKKG